MSRLATLLYGTVCYALFFVTFLYLIFFIEGLFVPKSLDAGPVLIESGPAWLINFALISLFGLQHSVMARPWFKKRWTKFVPRSCERSTFVLVTVGILALTFWAWRPMTGVIWDVQQPALRSVIWAISFGGWGIVFLSTFLINHFDLFGLRQVWIRFKNAEYTHLNFQTRSLYKLCRHPLMLGFIIAFWAAPTMTAGHLLYAAGMTGYILIALVFEEKDLVEALGQSYRDYQQRVNKLIPLPKFSKPTGGGAERTHAQPAHG